MNLNAVLSIHDYSFSCSLGCSVEERAHLQEVKASIKIEFHGLPLACESDQLEDTICYAQLCDKIKKVSEAKSFQTIEHLTHDIYLNLMHTILKEYRWLLSVQKVRPPVDGLKSGVSFEIGNLT